MFVSLDFEMRGKITIFNCVLEGSISDTLSTRLVYFVFKFDNTLCLVSSIFNNLTKYTLPVPVLGFKLTFMTTTIFLVTLWHLCWRSRMDAFVKNGNTIEMTYTSPPFVQTRVIALGGVQKIKMEI